MVLLCCLNCLIGRVIMLCCCLVSVSLVRLSVMIGVCLL